jgi:hypothetical protein
MDFPLPQAELFRRAPITVWLNQENQVEVISLPYCEDPLFHRVIPAVIEAGGEILGGKKMRFQIKGWGQWDWEQGNSRA